MRKKVLSFALTSILMSLCIPVCAQQQSDSTVSRTQLTADMIEKVQKYTMSHEEYRKLVKKSIESEYVIEIGKISKKTRARREDKENFTKKTYKVPEGITFKELIFSLPGIEIDNMGRLITQKRKNIVRTIDFNNQYVVFNDSDDPYYTNDTKLVTEPIFAIRDSLNGFSHLIYTDDTKLNTGTVYVQIKQCIRLEELIDQADIVIEYYPDVSPDQVGGNSVYVDLGLSVNWASRNVDAAGPGDMGGLFTWSEDDVAHVKLGGSRMPTADEIDELIYNCTWSWASVNGQIGYLVTSNKPGYTDHSIFLPYAFFGTSGELSYWAGSTDPDDPDRAACLWIQVYDDYVSSGSCYRHWPRPVRPVCAQNTESVDYNQGVWYNESRDSVIINTDAFKITDVSDSAMMEKIRRLPGVEIDEEGHIYVNGKKVDRILWGCNCSADDEDPELSELTQQMISKISKIDMLQQASRDILFVVDGKPVDSGWIHLRVLKKLLVDDYKKDKVAAVFGLKKKDVKAFRVLESKKAVTIWGDKGANGLVEVVTTKGYPAIVDNAQEYMDEYVIF